MLWTPGRECRHSILRREDCWSLAVTGALLLMGWEMGEELSQARARHSRLRQGYGGQAVRATSAGTLPARWAV